MLPRILAYRRRSFHPRMPCIVLQSRKAMFLQFQILRDLLPWLPPEVRERRLEVLLYTGGELDAVEPFLERQEIQHLLADSLPGDLFYCDKLELLVASREESPGVIHFLRERGLIPIIGNVRHDVLNTESITSSYLVHVMGRRVTHVVRFDRSMLNTAHARLKDGHLPGWMSDAQGNAVPDPEYRRWATFFLMLHKAGFTFKELANMNQRFKFAADSRTGKLWTTVQIRYSAIRAYFRFPLCRDTYQEIDFTEFVSPAYFGVEFCQIRDNRARINKRIRRRAHQLGYGRMRTASRFRIDWGWIMGTARGLPKKKRNEFLRRTKMHRSVKHPKRKLPLDKPPDEKEQQ